MGTNIRVTRIKLLKLSVFATSDVFVDQVHETSSFLSHQLPKLYYLHFSVVKARVSQSLPALFTDPLREATHRTYRSSTTQRPEVRHWWLFEIQQRNTNERGPWMGDT